MLALSDWLEGATIQTIIRLPMFICSLVFFVLLLKDVVKTYSGSGFKHLHNWSTFYRNDDLNSMYLYEYAYI